MSRCFPYPPPGYTLSRANKYALIESIKLQKERERTKDKEQRKQDKKREKKEKRKENKERKREKKDKANKTLDKSDLVRDHIGKRLWPNTKSELHKGHEAEPDQLERSSLTEEHGHAACFNAPSCSSDGTENSNKRKRQSSPEDSNRVHGKIIRIRLSKKPEDSNSSANVQQLCSTSGRAHFPSQPKNDISLTHRKQDSCTLNELCKIEPDSAQRINREKIPSTSQQIKTAAATRKTDVLAVKNAIMTPMQEMELHYNNLFENWAPPQLQDSSLPDDPSWLFQKKHQDRSTEEKSISGNAGMPCSGSRALWPHARYLQEVDVYALPFTVPF